MRLIERVLPAGRAVAAVEKLQDGVVKCWDINLMTEGAIEAIAILQGDATT